MFWKKKKKRSYDREHLKPVIRTIWIRKPEGVIPMPSAKLTAGISAILIAKCFIMLRDRIL